MLTKDCIRCGEQQPLQGVTTEGLRQWQSGVLIQNALPQTDPATREMLQSGLCPTCWDTLFDLDEG